MQIKLYLKGLNLIRPPSEKKSTKLLPKPCFDFIYSLTSVGSPSFTYVQSISSALPTGRQRYYTVHRISNSYNLDR